MELSGDVGERLRAVFDICDQEKKGYISVNHFVNLARENFGAGAGDQYNADMCRIIEVLDPEGDGKIHFGEFCQGVKQILELKSPCSPSPTLTMNGPSLFPLSQPQALGGDLTLLGQEEDTNSSGTHDTSELSTFNEYDMMTDDDQTPLAISTDCTNTFITDIMSLRPKSLEDDRDSAFSGKSSGTPEPRPDIEGIDESSKVYSDGGMEDCDTDSGSHTPSKHKHKHNEIRTHRRVTSNGLASQLYRYNAGERRNSYGSDEIFDGIDDNFGELNNKVKRLEAQIQSLTDNQQKTDQKQVKLKEENCSLVERIHLLEEQLREVEQKSHTKITDDERKYKETMVRAEKEKEMEIDILSQSLKHIEQEYQSLKEEAPRLRLENDRFKKENRRLERQLSKAHYQLAALANEHTELQHRHHDTNAEYDQERKVSAQLIDELGQELDAMRTKMEISGVKLSPRMSSHDLTRTQRREFEATISRLREENNHLTEEKDELLLGNHVQEGRKLCQGGMSLAEEIEKLPKDEILKTVRELQQENDTLRQYIERMTLRIIEKNPSILEIPIRRTNGKKK